MKIKILLICLICLFAAACSIKNEKITARNKEQLLEDAWWSMRLTSNDGDLLVDAFKESSFTGERVEGKTIGQVLAEKKRLQAEEDAADKRKREARESLFREIQARENLDTYVMVTPVKKTFYGSAVYDGVFDSRIQLDLMIENKSDKAIKTFSGHAIFRDRSGRVLAERLLTYYGLAYGEVGAGQKKHWTTMHRNNEMDPDGKAFRKLSLGRLTFEWQTRRIVFADGKTIGME